MNNYLRVLKKYGILFEDEDGLIEDLRRIPNVKDGETFKQWKIRAFTKDVEGLKVYAPYEPSQQTKMKSLGADGGSEYLLWAFSEYRDLTDEEVKSAISEAVEDKKNEITLKLTTFPKEMLRDILDDLDADLEPSAREFFERYLNSGDRKIKTKEMLTDLIGTYNNVVKQFREK